LITALKFLAKEQRNAETSYNCKNSLTATWLPVTQCACHQLQSIQTAVTQLQSLIWDCFLSTRLYNGFQHYSRS